MVRRGIIVVAVAAYLGIFGCAVWSEKRASGGANGANGAGETTQTTTGEAGSSAFRGAPLTGLPYRGVGIQIQRVDWIDKYEKCIDQIADLGADTVEFVVDTRQENGTSSHIYLDMRMTPTPDQLGQLIKHAKSRNLRVILMPIVLLDAPVNNEWRGTINPKSWDEWWDSYRAMLNHFAWIAESNGANVLVVGSELVSTEKYPEQWTRTIRLVRQVFKGQLTYSSNWDHYTSVPFWDQLDMIGMNSYWRLDENEKKEKVREKVTVPQIVENWRKIQGDLLKFVRKTGKPLLFLEIGWCSLANAASEPWDYTQPDAVDLDLQKRLYEGFFQSWYGRPELGGFSVWEWPPPDPDEARGYTPRGKPAEKVLREWLAKPRWEVK